MKDDKIPMKDREKCFAFRDNEGHLKCEALTEMICENKKCSFYKTAEQLKGGNNNG